MPVVLTDKSNRVWCVEQPDDGLLHVGTTGNSGPALIDILEFIGVRQKQFDKFRARQEDLREKCRRKAAISATKRQLGTETRDSFVSESRRDLRSRKE